MPIGTAISLLLELLLSRLDLAVCISAGFWRRWTLGSIMRWAEVFWSPYVGRELVILYSSKVLATLLMALSWSDLLAALDWLLRVRDLATHTVPI